MSEQENKNRCPFCKNLKHCQSVRIPVSESDRRTSLSLKAKYCNIHNIIFNTEKSNIKFWDGIQVVETCHGEIEGTNTLWGEYEFKNIGHKVDATQVLRLEVTTIDANVEVEGTIQAVEVPDGQNPVTYTGS